MMRKQMKEYSESMKNALNKTGEKWRENRPENQ
jgi:hypothetical protein